MAIVFEYINSITQKGETQNTLLLSCDENLFPPQRIDKMFAANPSTETLQAAAQVDYDLYVEQYAAVIDG